MFAYIIFIYFFFVVKSYFERKLCWDGFFPVTVISGTGIPGYNV